MMEHRSSAREQKTIEQRMMEHRNSAKERRKMEHRNSARERMVVRSFVKLKVVHTKLMEQRMKNVRKNPKRQTNGTELMTVDGIEPLEDPALDDQYRCRPHETNDDAMVVHTMSKEAGKSSMADRS